MDHIIVAGLMILAFLATILFILVIFSLDRYDDLMKNKVCKTDEFPLIDDSMSNIKNCKDYKFDETIQCNYYSWGQSVDPSFYYKGIGLNTNYIIEAKIKDKYLGKKNSPVTFLKTECLNYAKRMMNAIITEKDEKRKSEAKIKKEFKLNI